MKGTLVCGSVCLIGSRPGPTPLTSPRNSGPLTVCERGSISSPTSSLPVPPPSTPSSGTAANSRRACASQRSSEGAAWSSRSSASSGASVNRARRLYAPVVRYRRRLVVSLRRRVGSSGYGSLWSLIAPCPGVYREATSTPSREVREFEVTKDGATVLSLWPSISPPQAHTPSPPSHLSQHHLIIRWMHAPVRAICLMVCEAVGTHAADGPRAA